MVERETYYREKIEALQAEVEKLTRERDEANAMLYDAYGGDATATVVFQTRLNAELAKHPTEQTDARSGVRVRELEWWVANSGDIIADSIVGRYRLGKVAANANFRLETPDGLIEKPSPEYYWPEAEAKAAAQADYERRILSALSPAAPEGQQEAVDWQRVDDALVSVSGLIRALCNDDIGDVAAKELDYVRAALSRPTERAVTEAMVDRALACFKKHPRTPEQFGRFRETIRSALAAALSTSASTQGD